jgi:hypothetical protein
MPELNKANRQVCDVDIRILKTKKPFLFFDTANTTTAGLSGDSVYAMKKGTRAIAFHNPIEGTMTIEAQVMPFKAYALFSDGVIDSVATIAKKETITCSTAGQLTVTNAVAGTVFVFPEGEFGNSAIPGSYSSPTFTATNTADIAVGSRYEVGYLITKSSGVKKVAFNSKKVPKDYFITMSTLDKDEEGTLTPFIMTAYKATIQRNFELSFSSEGDPASVTITFDLLEDANGDVLDLIEDTAGADEFSVSTNSIVVAKGGVAPDIQIFGATGAVTATASNAKITATLSGDYDTVIISAAADATAGAYTVTIADAASNSTVIDVTVPA